MRSRGRFKRASRLPCSESRPNFVPDLWGYGEEHRVRYVDRPLRIKNAVRFFKSRNMTDCLHVLVPLHQIVKFVPHGKGTCFQVLTTEVSPIKSPLFKRMNQEAE